MVTGNNLNEFRRSIVSVPEEKDINTDTVDIDNEGSDIVESQDLDGQESSDTSSKSVDDSDSASAFGFITSEVTDGEGEEVEDVILGKRQVKVSIEEYLQSNENVLRDYLKYKDLNVDNLTDEQIVIEGLKRKYPRWTDSDLKDELRDRYGIGLSKKEITEDMDSDEIAEIKAYNDKIEDKIRSGGRHLRSDVDSYKKDILDFKQSLVLPEFETEVEVQTDVGNKTVEQVQQEIKEWREKEWIPAISETISKVKGVNTVVKVNVDEGVTEDLELTYLLSEKQKAELQEYMNNYVDHPSDAKFINEKGEVDYTGLVQEKAVQLFSNHIISSMVKEGIAKVKGDFIKNRLVNYEDSPSVSKPLTQAENSIQEIFAQRGAKRQLNKQSFTF